MFRRPRVKGLSNVGSRESLDSRTDSGQSPDLSPRYSSNESVSHNRGDMRLDNSNPLNRSAQYHVQFIGALDHVRITPSPTQDGEILLVEKIEEAQIEGKLAVKPQEDSRVTLVISKHGIRIATSNSEEIKWRFPLHAVEQLVIYESGISKYNLVLKIGQVGKVVYDCYVFQCENQEQSQVISQSLQSVFQALMQS